MLVFVFVLVGCFCWVQVCKGGIPTKPNYYAKQLIDHISTTTTTTTIENGTSWKESNNNNNNKKKKKVHWKQRYYINQDHFGGPGYPIFLILGGEGAIPPATGIFYPIVVDVYAKEFKALVLQPEHRFYGKSFPISQKEIRQSQRKNKIDPRIHLLTPEQALYDAVRLTHFIQDSYNCSSDRQNHYSYCPVISIGGSYPGFLSAMARLRFPQTIDMAYAASAPMKFYAQQVDPSAYYNHITQVAERAVPGCASAVQQTLQHFQSHLEPLSSPLDLVRASLLLGVCPGTLPDYVTQNSTFFINEFVMIMAYTFANHNMAYYPPSNDTALVKSCWTFLSPNLQPFQKIRQFLVQSLTFDDQDNNCFDFNGQLPSGPNATISSGDWSGVGSGTSGESWDFQTCTLLVEAIGLGEDSMFRPIRSWSLDWLKQHCAQRFHGVVPQPFQLVQDWKFDSDDSLANSTSRILFTNGCNDGWSVSAISNNISDSILVLNFPNGAHHSDLRGRYNDSTPEILEGFQQIQFILGSWLQELKKEKMAIK